MSSIPGDLLIDLTVQYVVPFLLKEATSLAARQAIGETRRTDARSYPRAPRLHLLPSSPSAKAQVLSETPGRVRLRIEGLRDDLCREAATTSVLMGLGGVRAVSANRLTGSVLVEYDPNRLTVARILAALEAGEPRPAVPPRLPKKSQKTARDDYRPRLALVGA